MKLLIVILASLSLIACGGGSSSKSTDSGVLVVEKNHQPIIDLVDTKTIASGEPLTLAPKVTDPDGHTLTYRWRASTDNVSIDTPSSASTIINFPKDNEDKSYSIELIATDEKGMTSSKIMKVLVKGSQSINQSPMIELVSTKLVQSGATTIFSPTVNDPDNDMMTYVWTSNDDSVIFSNASSLLSTVTFAPVNIEQTVVITLTATDSHDNSSAHNISVTIVPKENQSPVINLTSTKSVDSGAAIIFTPVVSDPEHDPLTYAWSSAHAGVEFAKPNALFSAITFPVVTAQQSIVVTLTVTDSYDNSAAHDITVTIVPAPNLPKVYAPIVTIKALGSGVAGASVIIKADIITNQIPVNAKWTFNEAEFLITAFKKLSSNRYEVLLETTLPMVDKFTSLPVTLKVTTDGELSNENESIILITPHVTPTLSVSLPESITLDEQQTKVISPTINHSHQIDSYQWQWKSETSIALGSRSRKTATIIAPSVNADTQATLILTVKMGEEVKIAETKVTVINDIQPVSLTQSRLVAAQGHKVVVDVVTQDPTEIVSASWVIQGFDNVTMEKSKTKLTFSVPKIYNSSMLSILYSAVLTDNSTIQKIVNVSVIDEGDVRNSLSVRPSKVTPTIRNNVLFNMPVLMVDSLKIVDSVEVTQPFTVNIFDLILIKRTGYFIQLPLKTNTILFDHEDSINLKVRVGDLVLDYPLYLSMKAD